MKIAIGILLLYLVSVGMATVIGKFVFGEDKSTKELIKIFAIAFAIIGVCIGAIFLISNFFI